MYHTKKSHDLREKMYAENFDDEKKTHIVFIINELDVVQWKKKHFNLQSDSVRKAKAKW